MNWVYKIIQINKVVVWLVPIILFVMFVPLTILSWAIASYILHFFTNSYTFTVITGILGFFLIVLFIVVMPLTLIQIMWTNARGDLLGNNWYNYKNKIGKDLYHLLEFSLNRNVLGIDAVYNTLDGCLKETQVRYSKDSDFFGNFLIYFLPPVFPLLGPIWYHRGRGQRGVIYDLFNNGLYILAGVEGFPLMGFLLFDYHLKLNIFYIQICGVDDKNKAFVAELENKIRSKLNGIHDIKFLTSNDRF